MHNHHECARILLDSGANFNEEDNQGRSPIEIAHESTQGVINKWIIHFVIMNFPLKNQVIIIYNHVYIRKKIKTDY
jgi:hypothetical protein